MVTFTVPSGPAIAQIGPAGPPPLIVAVIRSPSLLRFAPIIAVAASMRPIAALHVLLALWMSRACCANSVVSQINTRA